MQEPNPGSRHLYAGHRLVGQQAPSKLVPRLQHDLGFDVVIRGFDASSVVRLHSPSWISPDEVLPRLFRIRSPPRLFTDAACGGLKPPPAGRLRRAFLHLLHSTAFRFFLLEPPSAFRVHTKGCRCWSGYEWIARDKNERPRVCPLFKSGNWDKARRWGRPDLHRAS
jgi:hypothetical protein